MAAIAADDGYESDERGISRDVAFQSYLVSAERQVRSLAHHYEPATEVEIAQKRALQRIDMIRRRTLPPRVPLAHHYGLGLTSNHPIRVSNMPFFVDDCIDLDLRFTQPMESGAFDRGLRNVFGEDYNHLTRFLARNRRLPLSASPVVGHFQAHEQARCFLAILKMRPTAEDTYDPPALLDLTNMKDSLLPGCWPWPDQLGNLCAEDLEDDWQVMRTLDWVGQGTAWEDADFASGAHGDTPPHIICFLAQEAAIVEHSPASMPELHYITFMIRERLRDPAWTMHRFHPILLFMFDGVHFRITQAHFDGELLHLRRTEPVKLLFSSDDLLALKMGLRWALATPLDTTLRGRLYEASINETDMDTYAPPTPSRKAALRT